MENETAFALTADVSGDRLRSAPNRRDDVSLLGRLSPPGGDDASTILPSKEGEPFR